MVSYENNPPLMSQSLNAHVFVSGRPRSDICQCHSQAIEAVEDFFQVLAAAMLHSRRPIF